jgi:hypothetical protein
MPNLVRSSARFVRLVGLALITVLFVKANAYAVMGGILGAGGPDEKLAYLREHPELSNPTNRAAVSEMIDEAQQAGNGDQVRFFRSHQMLLDAAVMTSPEDAIDRAYRRG